MNNNPDNYYTIIRLFLKKIAFNRKKKKSGKNSLAEYLLDDTFVNMGDENFVVENRLPFSITSDSRAIIPERKRYRNGCSGGEALLYKGIFLWRVLIVCLTRT